VTRIIGRGIAEQLFAQLEGKKTIAAEKTGRIARGTLPSSGENNKDGQSTFSRFR
jgi:hypothetical protein